MEYQNVCSTFGCGEIYSTGHRRNDDAHCPRCGFSENEINNAGTNDPELLKIIVAARTRASEYTHDEFKRRYIVE